MDCPTRHWGQDTWILHPAWCGKWGLAGRTWHSWEPGLLGPIPVPGGVRSGGSELELGISKPGILNCMLDGLPYIETSICSLRADQSPQSLPGCTSKPLRPTSASAASPCLPPPRALPSEGPVLQPHITGSATWPLSQKGPLPQYSHQEWPTPPLTHAQSGAPQCPPISHAHSKEGGGDLIHPLLWCSGG